MDNAFTKGMDTDFGRIGCIQLTAGLCLKSAVLVALLLALFIAAPWYVIHEFNELQRKDKMVSAQWNQLVNQYARHAELIPGMLRIVEAHAAHEPEWLDDVENARAHLGAMTRQAAHSRGLDVLDGLQKAHNRLSHALVHLLLAAEADPELKSNLSFRDAVVQSEGMENRIEYCRQRYVGAVFDYNAFLRTFPARFIAWQAGLHPQPEPVADNVPSIASASDATFK